MAADRPTPTGPAAPEPAHRRVPGLPGRERLVVLPGHPPRGRPRRPRGLPHRHPRGLHRPAGRAAPRSREPHLLARGQGRLHRADARGDVARPRRRARGAPAASRRPVTTCAVARPARSRASPGSYNVIYDYADETVGLAAGTLAVRLVNHLVQTEEGFDFTEELDLFLRRAERTAFGPSTGGHPRGGRQPRHPLHPAQHRLAGAARPGRPRPAHPGHDDVEDRGAGRRHRQRQGHDDAAARLGGPAGAQAGDGPLG